MFREYLDIVLKTLEEVCTSQAQSMERAAKLMARTLCEDGLIYLFGCGHSHMLAEEGFYRAGGLGAVCAMLPVEFMLQEGAIKSSALERMECLAPQVYQRYEMTAKDTLVIFSTSGINGMPVEMARLAKAEGIPVIGVCSGAYGKEMPRHSLGLRLADVCEPVIDNCAPYGDAAYPIRNTEDQMGPLSTISGAYILNCLLARAAELAGDAGVKAEIYQSGNVTGGHEKNQAMIARYRGRIRAL
ncbi:MAG: SIS domain-containing protein [Clostridia bacterium]